MFKYGNTKIRTSDVQNKGDLILWHNSGMKLANLHFQTHHQLFRTANLVHFSVCLM